MQQQNHPKPTQVIAEQMRIVLFSVWEQLRKARRDLGWTEEDAADHLGVDLSTYQRWERGEQQPHFPRLLKLIEVFGIHALFTKQDIQFLQFLAQLDEKTRNTLLRYLIKRYQVEPTAFRRLLKHFETIFSLHSKMLE
jgi:transcriptional regulator with XRE-family HTH domain